MFKALKLHGYLCKTGSLNDIYRCNLLLQAYIDSNSLSEANKLLRSLPNPNIVSYNTLISGFFAANRVDEALKLFSSVAPQTDTRSWNIVISGCVRNQRREEAITHYRLMRRCSAEPDNFTYSIVVPCCGLGIGRQVHGEIVKVGAFSDAFVGTNVLKMYAESGVMEDAQKVFDEMSQRDLVTWNALISCYSKFGKGELSVELFKQLCREGVLADEYTYAIVLCEFASRLLVFEAMQVHSLMIRFGLCFDRFLNNSLLSLYSKCGFVASASLLFEEMPVRDVVSWTSMIVGFSQSGFGVEAILLLNKMRLANIEPNSYTYGALFSACANSNAFEKGIQLHSLVLKCGLETDVVVGSAIVDMYSKCGEMDNASRLFKSMPERDLVTWNGMICGFAQNGEGSKALTLFDEMVQSTSIVPNHVTFISVLTACSHCGLVKEGLSYFKQMVNEYHIEPKVEHYTCTVDLLARAGMLEEAEAMILKSPFKTDNIMWGALLGACKSHGNLDMARSVTSRLIVNEPSNSSSYVLLANTFTETGEWRGASEVREAMSARGAQKVTGCSWI